MREAARRQKHYRLDVLVESDRDREQLAMFIQGVLAQHRWHFGVKDFHLLDEAVIDAGAGSL
jgi:hypothetical protein